MKIKKITKSEIAEGLTVELVNRVNLNKKSSPVIFQLGDDPVNLMKCSKGYWILTSDGFLKDENGELLVFDERICQVARARYLLFHGDEEKELEAKKLFEKRKTIVWNKLEVFKRNLDEVKQYQDPNSTVSILARALESAMSEDQKISINARNKQLIDDLPNMEEAYNSLMDEYNKGNIDYLLTIMGLNKRENPISFKFDDKYDMKAFKNVFSKDAMESMNYDISKMFARLDIERKYSNKQ